MSDPLNYVAYWCVDGIHVNCEETVCDCPCHGEYINPIDSNVRFLIMLVGSAVLIYAGVIALALTIIASL